MSYKLLSTKGILLGTLSIPYKWRGPLENGGRVNFPLPLNVELAPTTPSADIVYGEMRRYGTLYFVSYPVDATSLYLTGCTIEEFEVIEGCTFCPSAAYLRSLMTEL